MAIKFEWMKRPFCDSSSTSVGTLMLSPDIHHPTWRKGKSTLEDKIAEVIAASGAEPGDIVEVDEYGTARVVGRSPRIAGEEGDKSEHAIRARIRKIYGNEAANIVDVTHSSNVIVFRKSESESSELPLA